MCSVFCVYPLCLTHHQISVINSTCKEAKKLKIKHMKTVSQNGWTMNRFYVPKRETNNNNKRGAEREREEARKRALKGPRHIWNSAGLSLFDISTRGRSDFFSEPFLRERAQRGIYIPIILVLCFSSLFRSIEVCWLKFVGGIESENIQMGKKVADSEKERDTKIKTVSQVASQPTKRPSDEPNKRPSNTIDMSYEFCVTIKIVINEDLLSLTLRVRISHCCVAYVLCVCLYVIHCCPLAFTILALRVYVLEMACFFPFVLNHVVPQDKWMSCTSFYMRKVRLLFVPHTARMLAMVFLFISRLLCT